MISHAAPHQGPHSSDTGTGQVENHVLIDIRYTPPQLKPQTRQLYESECLMLMKLYLKYLIHF